jgi:AcrR family transcriptional regulator
VPDTPSRGPSPRRRATPGPKAAKGPTGTGRAARVQGDYLDKAALVAQAAALADEQGWSALTLSAVARRVDRHVTSLYAHVASLDDLKHDVALLAMRELSDRVWEAALGRTRRDALEAIAAQYRRFALEHPGRAAAMVQQSRRPDDELRAAGERLAQPAFATLRSYGLDEAQVLHAYRVFSATLRGLVSFGPDLPDADTTFAEALDLLDGALSSRTWPSRPRSTAGSRSGSAPRRRAT